MGDIDFAELSWADELDFGEEVYMVRAGAKPSIVEKKLTPEERKQFDKAKDDSLIPWIDNHVWEKVPWSEALPDEICPLKFLLKWKATTDGHKANARVIMQGFKHRDVINEKLVTESPTLSKLGRNVALQWSTRRRC